MYCTKYEEPGLGEVTIFHRRFCRHFLPPVESLLALPLPLPDTIRLDPLPRRSSTICMCLKRVSTSLGICQIESNKRIKGVEDTEVPMTGLDTAGVLIAASHVRTSRAELGSVALSFAFLARAVLSKKVREASMVSSQPWSVIPPPPAPPPPCRSGQK